MINRYALLIYDLDMINIEPDHISFLSTHLHVQHIEVPHNTIIPFTPPPSFCATVVQYCCTF